jgi:hypothetical protein
MCAASRRGKRRKVNAVGTRTRFAVRAAAFAAPVIVVLAVALVAWNAFSRGQHIQQQGESALKRVLEQLRGQGYTINTALSGKYSAGTVLQTRETLPNHEFRELVPPLVFSWADRCFPGIVPRTSAYLLEETSQKTTASFRASAAEVQELLPGFALSGDVISGYSLTFTAPKAITYAKADVSEKFAPDCVAAYRAALRRESPDAFAIVLDTVVVNEVNYQIEWHSGANAEARLAATEQLTKKLDQGSIKASPASSLELQAVNETSQVTRVSAKAQVVLAYIARPLEPVRANDVISQ